MNAINQSKQLLVIGGDRSQSDQYSSLLAGKISENNLFEVRSCTSGEQALSLISATYPDVLVIDSSLPGISGLELVRQVRGDTSRKYHVGTILLLGEREQDFLGRALAVGVDDFCIREHMESELIARVTSVIKTSSSINTLNRANEKLRNANERLSKITITDDLTGLYNMRYFKKRLVQEFTRAQRYDKFLSIIMFDVDNFKRVNDLNDHLMGSFVLSALGKMVEDEIRTVDIAARFGGDEFVIMLPETGTNGALNAAVRIAQNVKKRIFENDARQFQITLSIGVSTFGPGSEVFKDATELMRRADQYLYEAKAGGRDLVIDLSTSKKNLPL
jgi:diguanylate cyclase (GGDEF)-like protein